MIETKKIIINNTKIIVNLDSEKSIINVNGINFDNKEDFVYFVNKLTDIAEELLEEDK